MANPDAQLELASPPGWSRRRRGPVLAIVIASVFIAILAMLSLIGPQVLFGRNPLAQDLDHTFLQPGEEGFWLGTDGLGRDVAARVLAGLGLSLLASVAAVGINLLVGVSMGTLAGWFGGWIDRGIMAVIQAGQAVPTVLIVLLLSVVMEPGLTAIILAIGLTYWLDMARLVRAEVRRLKEGPLVEAERALGASTLRILALHVMPGTWPVVTVTLAVLLPQAIFVEAFLGFVGLGVPAPQPSLGNLAAEGVTALRSYPHLLMAPGLALMLLVLAFQVLADGLRALLEPPG